jgi:hypothetical protein
MAHVSVPAQIHTGSPISWTGDQRISTHVKSLWRHLLGVACALTVVFTPGEGQLSIGLEGHEWVDVAVSRSIGPVAIPPQCHSPGKVVEAGVARVEVVCAVVAEVDLCSAWSVSAWA